MHEEIIKEVLKIKLSAAETVIDLLPPTVRESVKSHQQKMFQIINEVTSEYLEGKKAVVDNRGYDKGIKKIAIE
ncbi:MAG: hypothetical protein AAGU27_21430 [Dehalobacterium sp.]